MKILTYNIYEGGVGRVDPLAEVIRQSGADVAVLPETWETGLFYKLADKVGMDCFQAESPRNAHGHVGLLSKWAIRVAVNYGPLDDRLTRTAFHAVVAQPGTGKELVVIGTHLHARETLADEAIRMKEIPAVLAIAERFKGRPRVICGDFNASHPLQQIDVSATRPKTQERVKAQGNVFPREVIQAVLAAGYLDAHELTHKPADFRKSFTTTHQAMRVDYIFVSEELRGKVKRCEVISGGIGRYASDHYPVLAEIEL